MTYLNWKILFLNDFSVDSNATQLIFFATQQEGGSIAHLRMTALSQHFKIKKILSVNYISPC